ncbi:low temperature requirement protein A [Micromonospora parathelypteridis]|uniref:Low temperature requirement protein LtrA n=1 Tax=Micromonospora parathelypteridis TaxID=1839617 RepID=A0A840VUK5_9ACTN|nr:low temperature requirement protein A [Micromonospora parathelypteridis]MBB5475899.1 low temperature requirement protein LtrA [Micromonospora parathelypteridis]GGO31951.1 membrane protein [Micromonospora parathelypteridis]
MLRPTWFRGLGDSRSTPSATVLELLFDIVYVFALARLAGRVADDLTIVRHTLLSEAGQTVLFFTAMWMIWSLNALLASTYDPRRPDLQAVLLVTMFGTLVLAVSLPEAFGERGVVFACTYVFIQVGRPLLLTFALRGHPGRVFASRVLAWHTASAVLWIGGGISGGLGRGVFWSLALAVELLGAATAWPVPGGKRLSGARVITVSQVHLAERYNQFFMIALAEVVLEAGAAVSTPGFTTEGSITLVAAFLAVVSFWRIYFYHARSGQASTSGGEGTRLSRWASYSLLLIVGGIICTAVGFGQIIEDPHPPIDWALVAILFGGPVLFLLGRSFLEKDDRTTPRCRMLYLGVLALVVAAPPMVLLPPVAVAAATGLILAGIAVLDQGAHRRGSESNPTL